MILRASRRSACELEVRRPRHGREGLRGVGNHVVAQRFNFQPRECVIDAFDLLQADDVGCAIPEPGQQMVDPLPDRIDVPRSNTHQNVPADNATFSVLWHTMWYGAVITV